MAENNASSPPDEPDRQRRKAQGGQGSSPGSHRQGSTPPRSPAATQAVGEERLSLADHIGLLVAFAACFALATGWLPALIGYAVEAVRR